MTIIHLLTIAASCMGIAMTGICLMTGAIGTVLALATVVLFLFTSFYGFVSLIKD